MSKQTINIGASPNDGTGTPLRTSFDYTNQNFTELYTALGGGVGLPGATTQVIFNDGGTNLAGDAGLVYNKTTDTLTAGNATITGAATVGTTLGVTGVSTLTGNVGVGVTPTNIAGQTRVEIKGSGSGNLTLRTASSNAAARDWQVACNLDTFGELNFRQGASTGAEPNSGTTRMVLTAAGDVSVSTGNVVMATSGKGIDFSAVTGGTGTATANVLNDYEEGTWTGTLKGAVDPTIAVTATGRYTKVGRVVTVQIAFESVTTTGASGAITISGLPFTNNTSIRSIGTGGTYLGGTFTGSMITQISPNLSVIDYYGINSNAIWSSADHAAGAGRFFWANLTYTV